MNTLRLRMKPYIQPFERALAVQELCALSSVEYEGIVAGKNSEIEFTIVAECTPTALAERLAYWETVSADTQDYVTTQSLRESTVNLVRNGVALDTLAQQLPFDPDGTVPLPNRRCLRYGTHGIHEYRGKFFPQLVRSLINISGAPIGGVVADPMSGSGTTAVEAVLAGYSGIGLDMNPLSVFLGQAKCGLLSATPAELVTGYQQVRAELLSTEVRQVGQLTYLGSLPAEDQNYLRAWFSEDVLTGLDDISNAIARLPTEDARTLARVALSNIIRSVSWQKDDDLRVRKDVRLDVEIDPKKEFLEEMARSVRAVLAFLYQVGPMPRNRFEIREGDAKACGAAWGENSVDVVITSPPYATALPYLDTDRLSLCYLGLLPRPEHRARDQRMIGNREVSDKLRRDYWSLFQAAQHELPASVGSLITRIESLNSGTSVGFRRRNLPALLSKYFFDMKDVLNGVHMALKPGAMAFVVVGNNHTVAGGHRVDIQTASLLQEVAEMVGLEVAESLSMDMLVSRDIFRKNAMGSEEILAFRKPN